MWNIQELIWIKMSKHCISGIASTEDSVQYSGLIEDWTRHRMLEEPAGTVEFQPSPFFAEQLRAFELWLEHGSQQKRPPEQLPIVLQACTTACSRAWSVSAPATIDPLCVCMGEPFDRGEVGFVRLPHEYLFLSNTSPGILIKQREEGIRHVPMLLL